MIFQKNICATVQKCESLTGYTNDGKQISWHSDACGGFNQTKISSK